MGTRSRWSLPGFAISGIDQQKKLAVLVVGSGGREHALCWKIAQSPLLDRLWCAPGNPGTAQVAQNVPIRPEDQGELVGWAKKNRIDLVVVGPEGPLASGLVDALEGASIAAFGPRAEAAAIEGSKAFAKDVMRKANVPTPGCRVFESAKEAEGYAKTQGPIVVKADGLAAGKGVVVCDDAEAAIAAIRELSRSGAGRRLLLEERVVGPEVSLIALTDGEVLRVFPPARDHKRLLDGDQGPNTGGMGAICPVDLLPTGEAEPVAQRLIGPVLDELRRRGIGFRGALYAGLIKTSKGFQVLEFNCRLGDPEAQVLMLQTSEDLLPSLWACAKGGLSPGTLASHPGVSVGVVLAASGYPQEPRQGDRISGIEAAGPGVVVFHAGTRERDGQLFTSGGRVLTVCATGGSTQEAREAAYRGVERISFDGMQRRSDVGASVALR